VYGTGYHAAAKAGVSPRTTVTVIGDGAVGLMAILSAKQLGAERIAGGVISRVGVPQYEDAPVGFGSLFGPNITLTGGPAPARAYIDTLLPDVLSGAVDPGRVFDAEVQLADIARGYHDMDSRRALKVLVKP